MRITLDPGHGGSDPGAVGPGANKEAVLALQVALEAAAQLGFVGVEVKLTRKTDDYVSLPARLAMARDTKADAFVSIHCNSFTAPTAEGIETIYPSAGGPSKALANTVHQAVVKAAGAGHRDRGMKMSPSDGYPRRLYVLSHTDFPAVLVELEFLSHPVHEQWLASAGAQKSLGFALARGILQWVKGQTGVSEATA